MNSSEDHNNEVMMEHGRVIARAIDEVKVEKEKNMAKAEKRKSTMLERAAERALSGFNSK